MSISSNYPTIRPSLLLDFARAQALDPRVTFTRATSATRVNGDGLVEVVNAGVPRFDFDPITLNCKGLLIEEQRTNLVLYSEDFGNASWNKGNATVSTDTTTAPDGTTNADSLVDNATNGGHFLTSNSVTNSATTTYTASVFAKANTLPILSIWLRNADSSANYAWWQYDLSTGTVVTSGGGVVGTGYSNVSTTITAYPNGWYRCTLTTTVDVAVTSIRMWIREQETAGVTSYVGTGKSLYIWGAQVEAGAFPTSYIPTVASTVTRSSDEATMTGTNFSDWFDPAEGTVYVDAKTNITYAGINLFPFTYQIDDGTNNNRISNAVRVLSLYTDQSYSVITSGVSQATFDTNTNDGARKSAVAYKTNDVSFVVGGVVKNTDSVVTLPLLNRLSIGGRSGANWLNGTVAKVAYYPARLTNAQLQALTGS